MGIKHTPGPWHYRPEPHDDWGFVRATSSDSLPGEVVAVARRYNYIEDDVLNEHRRNGTDPCEANARLIAAAPELLEALTEILVTEPAVKGAVYERAKAAIAKATQP